MFSKVRVMLFLDKDLIIKSILFAVLIFCLLYSLHPGRFASTYAFIKQSDIPVELEPSPLVVETSKDDGQVLCPLLPNDLDNCLQYPNESVAECDMKELSIKLNIQMGGAWRPSNCVSRHQVAIIIPFRNRTTQLRIFLTYIHPFLQKQKLDYRILVIEQSNKLAFNRAKLFNVGYTEAMKIFPYHCFIFHDVDLIPQKLGNIYACTHQPRHMSSSLNTFRYNLPYRELFGGAVAILQKQFEYVNGFSNVFYGWGGEDDDFQSRVSNKGMKMCRFAPNVARYIMLTHAKELPSENRFVNLRSGRERFDTDGINTLKYSIIKAQNESLYTWLLVDL